MTEVIVGPVNLLLLLAKRLLRLLIVLERSAATTQLLLRRRLLRVAIDMVGWGGWRCHWSTIPAVTVVLLIHGARWRLLLLVNGLWWLLRWRLLHHGRGLLHHRGRLLHLLLVRRLVRREGRVLLLLVWRRLGRLLRHHPWRCLVWRRGRWYLSGGGAIIEDLLEGREQLARAWRTADATEQ